ncbi:MAG: methyltransferase domain-containing protein [Planctomycetes bacterium]|nr:methyltransferase domain-containing protein [Planctomycetota bacterium]
MQPNPSRIIDMASAFYDSCVLFTASDLGVFATLSELGKADAATVARSLGLDERGATLLLDGCVAVRLLEKNDGLYNNTTESAIFLVPGSPANLQGAIRYNRDVYDAWSKLSGLARTGSPVEKPELHLGEDEERTRTFVLSMHGRALGIGQAVVPQLDLSGCKKLFDVGGGPGTYSVLVAKANPDIECTVLDLPGVVKVAAELVEKQGMSDRVKTIPGDYRTAEFPSGNDAVLFFGMLHQESPDSIRSLMKRAYESLNPGGKVYVMDMMTDASHTSPKFSALFAVNMALTTENGWVFSDEELKGWMEEAGFNDFAVKPLAPPMPHWLATAKK